MAVVLGHRPRIRPGSKEKLEEPVVEDVEETREGLVIVDHPSIRLLGGTEGQCALRSQKPEETHEEAEPSGIVPARRLDGGGRKLHEGVLPEQDVVLAQGRAVADAGLAGVEALCPAQDVEDVIDPGLVQQVGPRARHVSLLRPTRGGNRAMTPRSTLLSTVSVKWFIDAYSARKRSSTRPSR